MAEQREKGSSILRSFAMLESVVAADRAVSPAELAGLVGMPKASAHRLARQLEQAGLLQRELDGRKLIPGSRLNALAMSILGSSGQRAARHAILQTVSAEIGETCNVSIPDGSEMKRAFAYDWRLWSIPELRDLLAEAGFVDTEVYWEATDRKTGEGNGNYYKAESALDDPAWVAYIVGVHEA